MHTVFGIDDVTQQHLFFPLQHVSVWKPLIKPRTQKFTKVKKEHRNLSKRRSKSEWLFDGNDLTRRDGINKPSELSIVYVCKSYLRYHSLRKNNQLSSNSCYYIIHCGQILFLSLFLALLLFCRVFFQSNLNETCVQGFGWNII
jgi:hypothetical protein